MKSVTTVKFCGLLVLGLYLLCPANVFAKDHDLFPTSIPAPSIPPSPIPGDTPPKDKGQDKKDPLNNKAANQQQPTSNQQDEDIAKNLFKDATYEKFDPQDNAESKIFDADY